MQVGCAGLFERFQLSYNQCRVAASEASEAFEVTDTGFMQDILRIAPGQHGAAVYIRRIKQKH
ncbi:hypothetical protein AAG906_029749 [Vitis piasezkii]|uniref:Uncharacterized protein n=1 Tax=Vitis vinifera TaxID=29760 RepID=A0A438G6K6_VITVI|nr:hypothetical protein CK203_066180 [Vitis vinifera]